MNRKVKAIVNAAVAMGFGEASDYHGNSIAEVLEEFAAIAKQSNQNSTFVIPILWNGSEGKYYTTATIEEIRNALIAKNRIEIDVAGEGTFAANNYRVYEDGNRFYVYGNYTEDHMDNIVTYRVGVSYSYDPREGEDFRVYHEDLYSEKFGQ